MYTVHCTQTWAKYRAMVGYLVQFDLVVKGHGGDSFLSCILDMGGLLAGIGIDDQIRRDTKVQNGLDFSLRERARQREREGGKGGGGREGGKGGGGKGGGEE